MVYRKLIVLLFTLVFAVILTGAASSASSNGFTNNKKVVNSIQGKDLIVSSITLPAKGAQGKTITVSNTIKNQGSAATTGFYVKFYLRQSSTSPTIYYIGYRYIGGLGAGASRSANSVLKIPTAVRTGNYHLIVFADSSNAIRETNESNNKRYSTSIININPYPITIDTYKKSFDPEVSTDYYIIKAKQTATDTIVVNLVNYSISGVFKYSGTSTIHKIGSSQISEKYIWDNLPQYNTYEVFNSILSVKQYYYQVWKPNLFK